MYIDYVSKTKIANLKYRFFVWGNYFFIVLGSAISLFYAFCSLFDAQLNSRSGTLFVVSILGCVTSYFCIRGFVNDWKEGKETKKRLKNFLLRPNESNSKDQIREAKTQLSYKVDFYTLMLLERSKRETQRIKKRLGKLGWLLTERERMETCLAQSKELISKLDNNERLSICELNEINKYLFSLNEYRCAILKLKEQKPT